MTPGPMHDFIRYWRNIRGRTSRLLDVTPDARLDWSPGAGAMTIGDEFRHIALTGRWLFVEVARGETHLKSGRPIACVFMRKVLGDRDRRH